MAQAKREFPTNNEGRSKTLFYGLDIGYLITSGSRVAPPRACSQARYLIDEICYLLRFPAGRLTLSKA